MIYFLILGLLFISMILLFLNYRRSIEQFRCSNMTIRQRLTLSLACASLIQLFLIPAIPGWVIAVSIIGYKDIHITPLESVIFAVIMMLANTVIYYFVFYFAITWLSRLLAINNSDK